MMKMKIVQISFVVIGFPQPKLKIGQLKKLNQKHSLLMRELLFLGYKWQCYYLVHRLQCLHSLLEVVRNTFFSPFFFLHFFLHFTFSFYLADVAYFGMAMLPVGLMFTLYALRTYLIRSDRIK